VDNKINYYADLSYEYDEDNYSRDKKEKAGSFDCKGEITSVLAVCPDGKRRTVRSCKSSPSLQIVSDKNPAVISAGFLFRPN
jgi:hypothetical protein